MSKIPETDAGLSEEQAVQVGTILREGLDILRSLQFNKKASILRYEIVDEGKPHLGIEPTKELVSGLDDLDVYVSRVSTREILAGRGRIELTDLKFIFYEEVRDTDEIVYNGKTYKVVQVEYYDPDIGRSIVIARAV